MKVLKPIFIIIAFFFICLMIASWNETQNPSKLMGLVFVGGGITPLTAWLVLKKGTPSEAEFEDHWYENF